MDKPVENVSKTTEKAVSGKISVNLLPEEIIIQRKQSSKLLFINRLSIAALIILIFFASATLALRLSQNLKLQNSMDVLAQAQSKVSSLKGKEEQVSMIKQRLNSIQSLTQGDVKRKAIFNMMVFLAPPDMQITEVSVDRNGNMNISYTASTISSINTLLSDLSNKEKNLGLIGKADLEGLSMGKDSAYRFGLKITAKK